MGKRLHTIRPAGPAFGRHAGGRRRADAHLLPRCARGAARRRVRSAGWHRRHRPATPAGPPLPTRAGVRLYRGSLHAEAFEGRRQAESGDLAVALVGQKHARRLARLPVPDVRRQGDFWPRNALVRGNDVRVVNWEHSDVGSPPSNNLFMLLISHSALLPPHAFGSHSSTDGFLCALVTSGRRPKEYSAVAAWIFLRWGLAATDVPVLLVDFLLAMTESPSLGEVEEWRALFRACLGRGEGW